MPRHRKLPAELGSWRAIRPLVWWAPFVLVAVVATYIIEAACTAAPSGTQCAQPGSFVQWLAPAAIGIWALVGVYSAWRAYRDHFVGELAEERARRGFDTD